MGGKTSTSQSSVQIPESVLHRYDVVNQLADTVAATPFQQYGGQFVAGLNSTQQAGIQNINNAAGLAQPYIDQGAAYTQAGSQSVGPLTQQQISYYQSPYNQAVADTTFANLRQQQQQEQSSLVNPSSVHAFGGDRGGLAAANLARQQGLATGQTMANIYQQGYGQALNTAVGQQGIQAQNYERLLHGGQQMAGLGQAAQQAAIQGGQAQIGAGTLGQQTQQADLTARYQQFLQERGYPFQTAQFLANIAMGTGALSGSTTTTTQPAPFFSDRRLKESIRRIGETDDGVPIYKFKYKGDPKEQTHIGFMADEVAEKTPEAVGEYGGYKTVDYDRATKHYAGGGIVSGDDIAAILAAQKQAFGPFSQAGLYGQPSGGSPGLGGIVPAATLPVGKLITADRMPTPPKSGLQELMGAGQQMGDLGKMADSAWSGLGKVRGWMAPKPEVDTRGSRDDYAEGSAWRGGGFAEGGEIEPYDLSDDPLSDVVKNGKQQIRSLPKPGQPPGQQQSGFSQLAGLASGVNGLMSAGSGLGSLLGSLILLKDGGRAGYAEGGEPLDIAPDDPSFADMVSRMANAIRGIESTHNYGIRGPVSPKGDRPYGAYQVMGSNVGPWTEEALGRRMTPQEFLADREAQDAVARHRLGQYIRQTGNPDDAASMWFSGRPIAKAGNSADVTGTSVPEYIRRFRAAYGQDVAPEAAPTGLGVVAQKVAAPVADDRLSPPVQFQTGKPFDSWSDFLTSRQFVVPLLSGFGAMASSNSRYLGSAMLQGLGKGAEAYSGLEKQEADIGARKAQTFGALTQAANENFRVLPNGMVMVRLTDGRTVPYDKYLEMGEPPLAGGDATAQAARAAWQRYNQPKETILPKVAAPPIVPKTSDITPGITYDETSRKRANEDRTQRYSGNSAAIEEGAKSYQKSTSDMAAAARSTAPVMREMVRNVGDIIGGAGASTAGAGFYGRAQAIKVANTIADAFGAKDANGRAIHFDDREVNGALGDAAKTAAIEGKVNALLSGLQTHGIDQRSYRALETMLNAMPQGNMDPAAQAELASTLFVLNRRDQDRFTHMRQWMKDSNNTPFSAGEDFDEKHSRMYDDAAHLIKTAMLRLPTEFKTIMASKAKPEEINKLFDRLAELEGRPKVANMARFFGER